MAEPTTPKQKHKTAKKQEDEQIADDWSSAKLRAVARDVGLKVNDGSTDNATRAALATFWWDHYHDTTPVGAVLRGTRWRQGGPPPPPKDVDMTAVGTPSPLPPTPAGAPQQSGEAPRRRREPPSPPIQGRRRPDPEPETPQERALRPLYNLFPRDSPDTQEYFAAAIAEERAGRPSRQTHATFERRSLLVASTVLEGTRAALLRGDVDEALALLEGGSCAVNARLQTNIDSTERGSWPDTDGLEHLFGPGPELSYKRDGRRVGSRDEQGCYNCGDPGHWVRDCPEPRRGQAGKRQQQLPHHRDREHDHDRNRERDTDCDPYYEEEPQERHGRRQLRPPEQRGGQLHRPLPPPDDYPDDDRRQQSRPPLRGRP